MARTDVRLGERIAVVLMCSDFRAWRVRVLRRDSRRLFWVTMEVWRACCAVVPPGGEMKCAGVGD